MERKIFAIGDIHGCLDELEVLIRRLQKKAGLNPDDLLVFLGDYIDRGPESFGVIEYLLGLNQEFDCRFLMGNHELFFLQHLREPGSRHEDVWLQCGGTETLSSYSRVLYDTDLPKAIRPEDMPPEHLEFLERGLPWFEVRLEGHVHFFSHAQPPPHLVDLTAVKDLEHQTGFESPLFWGKVRPRDALRLPGVTLYSGHTPQNEVIDMDGAVFLDTGCCYGQRLSAMDITTREVFSALAGERLPEDKDADEAV